LAIPGALDRPSRKVPSEVAFPATEEARFCLRPSAWARVPEDAAGPPGPSRRSGRDFPEWDAADDPAPARGRVAYTN